jgi:hypothetical protein
VQTPVHPGTFRQDVHTVNDVQLFVVEGLQVHRLDAVHAVHCCHLAQRLFELYLIE